MGYIYYDITNNVFFKRYYINSNNTISNIMLDEKHSLTYHYYDIMDSNTTSGSEYTSISINLKNKPNANDIYKVLANELMNNNTASTHTLINKNVDEDVMAIATIVQHNYVDFKIRDICYVLVLMDNNIYYIQINPHHVFLQIIIHIHALVAQPSI